VVCAGEVAVAASVVMQLRNVVDCVAKIKTADRGSYDQERSVIVMLRYSEASCQAGKMLRRTSA
jgi:hypothetical protein